MNSHKLAGIARHAAWPALSVAAILLVPLTGLAQTMPPDHAGHQHPATTPSNMSPGDQVKELQAKVAELQMALRHRQMGMGGSEVKAPMGAMPPNDSAAMPGMGKMPESDGKDMSAMPGGGAGMPGMMKDMGGMMQSAPKEGAKAAPAMGGMGGGKMGTMPPEPPAAGAMEGMAPKAKGMQSMMGMAPHAPMETPAALPGFPGALQLYHMGADDFFLDHDQHLALTAEQRTAIGMIKDTAMLAKTTTDQKNTQAEQELFQLTGSDRPDAAKVEAKIQEIEKLRSNDRMSFIRAVGEAAKVLTEPQRQSLTGQTASQESSPQPMQAAPAGAMPATPSAPAGAGGMGGM